MNPNAQEALAMTRCTNCGTRWTFKDKLRKSFSFDRGMSCPHCGEAQYLTWRYRKKSSLTTFLMLLLFFLPSFFNAPWQVHVSVLIPTLSAGILFQVHTFELTDNDDGDFWKV
ncbi:TIGR04104 family putative zinc finger protein [Salinicoccus bachuensis]|uniref:TIGR04104 family putative zinc finger protein n=1 Tax=Salinicoccus bachuensis TaxID=3136731 RepID=A0ABZ3IE80_9STAP